jgi:hypothetical protein
MKDTGTVSLERMYHFRCKACERWWSIADAPGNPAEREWYCPWCGLHQSVGDKTPQKLT